MKRFLLNVLFVLPVLLLPSCFNSKPSNTSISSSYHYSRPSFEEPTELMMDLTLPDSEIEPTVLLTDVTYEITVYSPNKLCFYWKDVKLSNNSTASFLSAREGEEKGINNRFRFFMKDLKTNDDYIIALSYKEFYLEKHYQVIDDTYDAKVLYRINNRWDFDKDSYLFTNYEDYLLFHKMINSTYIDINEELFDDRYLLVAHFWSSKYSCRNLSFNSSFVASGITYFQFEAIYIPFQDFEISASYIFWILVPQSISLDYIINYYVIYES